MIVPGAEHYREIADSHARRPWRVSSQGYCIPAIQRGRRVRFGLKYRDTNGAMAGCACADYGRAGRWRWVGSSHWSNLQHERQNLFLPDEIIAARVAELADMCGAAGVNRAVDA
jgi:hypothetical protein